MIFSLEVLDQKTYEIAVIAASPTERRQIQRALQGHWAKHKIIAAKDPRSMIVQIRAYSEHDARENLRVDIKNALTAQQPGNADPDAATSTRKGA